MRRLVLFAALAVFVGLLPWPTRAGVVDPGLRATAHLSRFVALSQPPEYRRFGSPGMAAAADHAATTLARAGYAVHRVDAVFEHDDVDYSPGHEPALTRLSDGATFPTERAFLSGATPPEGITCAVRAVDAVGPGDCGLVPFDVASPEWNNVLSDGAGPVVDQIVARGGIGAVVQGDPERRARLALRLRKPIPVVSSVVDPVDVLGQVVSLRSIGAPAPAVARNVVAVRRPPQPGGRYLVLQGHLDGWFQAAADNAAGAAAVLAAAEALAEADLGSGLVVALYDAEEWGLLGSRAVVDVLESAAGLDIGDGGPALRLADIAAVVNLDVPSARPSDVRRSVAAVGHVDLPLFSWRAMLFSEEPVLSAVFLATMAAHGVLGLPLTAALAEPLNGGLNRSDTRWFHEAGIPVVWPVAGYPEYHTDVDTLDAVDLGDLAALTRATVDLVVRASRLDIGRVAGS